jgi:hypothetical protein
MCQGNGVYPAVWTVISIPMTSAHKRKGHIAHFIAPISNLPCHLAGGLFVDNMDLFYIDMQTVKSTAKAHEVLQEAVINWGKLLIATGGAFKLAKFPYYLISFKWKAGGAWLYDQHELNPDLALGVLMFVVWSRLNTSQLTLQSRH